MEGGMKVEKKSFGRLFLLHPRTKYLLSLLKALGKLLLHTDLVTFSQNIEMVCFRATRFSIFLAEDQERFTQHEIFRQFNDQSFIVPPIFFQKNIKIRLKLIIRRGLNISPLLESN